MTKKAYVVVMVMAGAVTWQGCENETVEGPVDCTKNPVMLEVVSVEDADCDLMDGSITVAATGGGGEYRYSLDGGAEQTEPVFEGLGAGVFEITVLDKNECSANVEAVVQSTSGLEATVETTVSGCKSSNGTLTVNAMNGTGPYQFKLGTGGFGESSSFTNLAAGEYALVVKDANGCEVSQKVHVPSGISYSATISGIIETKCAISGCHNGSQAPDFRNFNNIRTNAAQIKTLTGNGTMPQDDTLTQEQISQIACWVDDGAPQN